MVIDEHLGYFISIAEGRQSRPWDEWWNEHHKQLESQLRRTEYLRLKFRSYDEVCRILDSRGIEYEKSLKNVNIHATRLPLNHDPQERDPKIQRIIAQAEDRAMTLLEYERRGMGFCHSVWKTKKRILKEEFGIDWKTPAEMNPDVHFD